MTRSLALGLCILVFGLVDAGYAQRAIGPYQPATPALSPYLYLTRPDFGALPNYQAFVEPLVNQQRTNLQQQSQISRLRTELQQTEQQLYAPAGVSATGTAATFRNFSHFYPGKSAGPSGRARR